MSIVEERSSGSPLASGLPKRKRAEKVFLELELDIGAPEPESKKARRKAKKDKGAAKAKSFSKPLEKAPTESATTEPQTNPPALQLAKRSDFGVWIGNLPWTVTKLDLRSFLVENAKLAEKEITRVHMPGASEKEPRNSKNRKSQNKGFAYVDLSSEEAMARVIRLSEGLVQGRRILIKNAKSFEGRPEARTTKKGEESAPHSDANPPNHRVYVGNLPFDTTQEEFNKHFAQCGEIATLFMATFEDSGECKGYGWITFSDIESAKQAVRGWIEVHDDEGSEESSEEGDARNSRPKNPRKLRRKRINRLKGRDLRLEFAEDATVRYKKRFGKKPQLRQDKQSEPDPRPLTGSGDAEVGNGLRRGSSDGRNQVQGYQQTANAEGRQRERPPQGVESMETAYRTGAMIEGTGIKKKFD